MNTCFIALSNRDSQLFIALIIFIGINYITGLFVLLAERKWLKEKLGIKNILGKIGSLLLIYVAHIIDAIIIRDAALSSIVILFYLSKEGMGILDNLEQLGVPLPSPIVKIIKQLNHGNDEE